MDNTFDDYSYSDFPTTDNFQKVLDELKTATQPKTHYEDSYEDDYEDDFPYDPWSWDYDHNEVIEGVTLDSIPITKEALGLEDSFSDEWDDSADERPDPNDWSHLASRFDEDERG